MNLAGVFKDKYIVASPSARSARQHQGRGVSPGTSLEKTVKARGAGDRGWRLIEFALNQFENRA